MNNLRNVSGEGVQKPRKNVNSYFMNATPYNIAGARKGEASILDKDIINSEAKKRSANMGEGAYSVQYYGDDGKPILDGYIEEKGLVFNAVDGRFRKVDQGYLNDIKRKIDAQNEYINDIMELCVDDHIVSKILGISDIGAELDRNKGTRAIVGDDLIPFSGMPSYLNTLWDKSTQYTAGVAKLRMVVKHFLPIVIGTDKTGTTENLIANENGGNGAPVAP